MHKYKELKVWEKSMDLVVDVYAKSKNFPSEEKFGLTSQVRRAAVSISSNIAEGAGRNTNKDFSRFLDMSAGSLFEVETQLLVAMRVGFLEKSETNEILTQISEIHLMIIGLKKSLKI